MQELLLKIWKTLHLPKDIKLFLMRRFNDQFLVGVTGIFFDDRDHVLLVKHTYRGSGHWSLPGGYAKSGEHPTEALEREVKEETGYEVSADERLKIRTDRESARLDITYMGAFLGGVFVASKEVSEAKLFEFDELPILTGDQFLFIDKALEKRKALKLRRMKKRFYNSRR